MNKKIIKKIFKPLLISLLITGSALGIFYFHEDIPIINKLFRHKQEMKIDFLIPAKQSDRGDIGFVNLNGELTIDFNLELDSGENMSYIYEGKGFYHENETESIVFIDTNLEKTITNYHDALYFHEGLCLVSEKFGSLKYIDQNLNEAINLSEIQEAGYFSEGLAKVKNKDNLWGYINKQGEMIIEPQYTEAYIFINGYAIVVKENDNYISNNLEYGVINKKGKEIIAISDRYNYIKESGKEGFRFEDEKTSGFLNNSSKRFIENDDWDYLLPFHNQYASFAEKKGRRTKWGLINIKGEEIINPNEGQPIVLFNHLYQYENRGEWGYKDIKQEEIIKAKYEKVYPFIKEGAFVKEKGKWKYINKDGDIIKDKDHDIKHLLFEEDENLIFNLITYKTPFDLNKTLHSRELNVPKLQSTINEIFQDTDRELGVKDIIMNIIKYHNFNDTLSIEGIINKLSTQYTHISSEIISEFAKEEIPELDNNFKYDLHFNFDNYPVQSKPELIRTCNTDHYYSCDYVIETYGKAHHEEYYMQEKLIENDSVNIVNEDAILEKVSLSIQLNNNAKDRRSEIKEKLEDFFFDLGYSPSESGHLFNDNQSIFLKDDENDNNLLHITLEL